MLAIQDLLSDMQHFYKIYATVRAMSESIDVTTCQKGLNPPEAIGNIGLTWSRSLYALKGRIKIAA
ncbi:hypothetical protein [Vibrio albus]|uniref:hypothetical protein n=1 Tax=Vibrio albus TaxID=2200953 RepID=UPI0011B28ABE|nr:hypothetical protein [Vibrio albus]